MASKSSGMDELKRLSQRFTRMEEEQTRVQKQRAARAQTIQGALQGLKEIKLSVALQQLKAVAKADVVRQVGSLKNKQGTDDLRKLISEVADELERKIDRIPGSNPELERSVKTLIILLDLFFSMQ